MVARAKSTVSVQGNPEDILKHYPDQEILMGVRGFPDRGVKGLREHADKLKVQAQMDAEFGLNLLEEYDWDVFFIYWSTIDAIGHFFWSYYDPEYPGFEEGNPLQGVIRETYQLYDQIIGKFLASVEEDVSVMVVSDHGHGSRPFNLVNVNEILRQGGWLVTKDLRQKPFVGLLETLKRAGVKAVSRFGLAKLAGRVLRFMPGVKTV